MKNKTSIIVALILLSIIIFGLVMFLVVYLCGGNMELFSFGSQNKQVIFEETFQGEDIKYIDIKQDAGNVILKESLDNNIQVIAYGKDNENIDVQLQNGTLLVDYTQKHRFVFFHFGNIKNDIIVFVPASYSNEIKVQCDLGNCEVTDLENATLDIDSDAGNVGIGKVKNANIQCDLGKVEVKEVFNQCDIEVNSGNVDIEALSIQEDSRIKVDLGNINIKETNDIYVDAHVDLGNSSVNGSNRNANVTLKLECDCGNISVGK